ncbi:MAG TPA: hypothetical protein VGA74_05140 [Actinomycetota bacterium]
MRTFARPLLAASLGAAAMSCSTGVAYFLEPRLASPPIGAWLGTLALLGSSALAAVGLWQERAPNQVRALLLVVLCGLAGGFVAANVLALAVSTDGGLPGAPRPLHWGGLVSGALLYASGMLETSRSFFRGRDATD